MTTFHRHYHLSFEFCVSDGKAPDDPYVAAVIAALLADPAILGKTVASWCAWELAHQDGGEPGEMCGMLGVPFGTHDLLRLWCGLRLPPATREHLTWLVGTEGEDHDTAHVFCEDVGAAFSVTPMMGEVLEPTAATAAD